MNIFKLIACDVRCVFDRDPSARHMLEVIFCYAGVQAVIGYRFCHLLWRFRLKFLARFFSSVIRWLTGVEIHPAAEIGPSFFIDHGLGVVIGETAQIGAGCTLYHDVTLGGLSWQTGKRHPTLKNNVVVGAGAQVLGNIVLENCVKVGANAVVLKSVKAGQTVVGVSAKVIAHKTPHTLDDHFEAYGINPTDKDPVSELVKRLEAKVKALEQSITNHHR